MSGTRNNISDSTRILYLCAWHLYFHTRVRAPPTPTIEAALTHVLDFLSGIGYQVGPLREALRLSTGGDTEVAAMLSELEDIKKRWLQQRTANREDEESPSWQQCFYLVSAIHTLQSLLNGDASPTALPELLAEATTLHGRDHAPRWEPVVDLSSASSAVFTLTHAATDEVVAWQEARQYAALAFASSYRAPALLAKLLLLYVLGSPVATAEALRDATAAARTTEHKRLVAARLKGIVSGVLEVVLRVAAGGSRQTAAALDRLVQHAPPTSTTLLALAVAPVAEDLAVVTEGAALVLSALVNEAQHQQLEEEPATTANEESSFATAAAQEVVHHLQELLFTLVLGDGTTQMNTRPATATTATAALVATMRPLLLAGADALTLHLLPALLQQIGFEWPWSALLRHCRALDKQQRPAVYPAVAWASAVVFDGLLAAVAARTYGERLQQFLPGSYDRLLNSLGLLPEEGETAAGDEAQQTPTTTISTTTKLFAPPAYYKDAAQPVVKYLAAAGLGGIVLEELELELDRAIGALPMIVQLRALAATATADDSKSGPATALRRLSPERVEELAERYKGEVLLVAVVVHTQLQVPSHVQQLMRLLAPLFAKVAVALGQQDTGGSPALLAEGGGAFTAEAELLMEHVGYQFYALEWLPAYTQWSLQKVKGGTSHSSGTSSSSSSHLPYSLFAAVAYQFELQLRNGPGSAGSGALRLPCGVRADVVTSDVREAISLETWRRTSRYLEHLLELTYLDARTSGSDLEGMLSVLSHSRADNTSNSNNGGGAAASAALGSLRRLAASVPDGQALLTELLQPPVFPCEGAAPPAKRSKTEAGEEAAVLASMAKLFLLHGAASFDTTVEIKDILFTVLQCFLPPLVQLHVGKSLSIASPAAGKRPTAQLLALAQSGWCHDVLVVSNIQTKLHQAQPEKVTSTAGLSYEQVLHRNAASAYNSVTLDGCALAREVLRRAPLRLLHKMQTRLAQETAFYEIIRHKRAEEREEDNGLPSPPAVDTLLSLQWTQWNHYMQQLLGVLPSRQQQQPLSSASSPVVEPDQVLAYFAAAQYMWFSPYVVQEMSAIDL